MGGIRSGFVPVLIRFLPMPSFVTGLHPDKGLSLR